MFAVGEDVDALVHPGVEAFFPGGEFFGCVVFLAQTNVGEIRSEDIGWSLFFSFGEAEGDVVFAEGCVGFFGVPGGVAHFKGELKCRRAKREEFFEQGLIEFEIGRELHEDRAEMVAVVEDARDFEESLECAL